VNAAGPGATGGAALEAEGRLRAQLARIDRRREQEPDMPLQVAARLETVELACVAQLRKITGEGETIDESKIVRLPAWRRMVERVVEALRPHPAAAADVARALRGMGGEE